MNFNDIDGKPIAIFCGDIHLSLNPPRARRHEPDWFAAMARPLDEMGNLAKELKVPIFCAGDLFDYWKAEPELINFAIEHVPHMYSIPGQHDLPFHNIDLIQKSAFWTLIKARVIESMQPNWTFQNSTYCVTNFPWGKEIHPPENPDIVNIALIHAYVWKNGAGYVTAPIKSHVDSYKDVLSSYDFAVFGDNHTPFDYTKDGTTIFNCGSFMRRKSDEIDHEPRIGILTDENIMISYELSSVHDVITLTEDAEITHKAFSDDDTSNLTSFIGELNDLKSSFMDFKEHVMRKIDERNIKEEVKSIILHALENDA